MVKDFRRKPADWNRFSYFMTDKVPTWVTDDPPASIEDNMWLLDRIAKLQATDRALQQQDYKTFYMSEPFRLTVLYIGRDRYGFISSSPFVL